MKVYFNKHLIQNRFIVGGKAAPFEQIGDSQGLLVLDDADPNHKELIDALTQAAKEQRGGILKISEEEYLKKKAELPFSQSEQELKQRKQMVGIVPPLQKPRPKPVYASPAAPVVKSQEEAAWNSVPRNTQGLRLDGPTRQEFIDSGYDLKNYPPAGYAERDKPAKDDPAVTRFRPKTQKLPQGNK